MLFLCKRVLRLCTFRDFCEQPIMKKLLCVTKKTRERDLIIGIILFSTLTYTDTIFATGK